MFKTVVAVGNGVGVGFFTNTLTAEITNPSGEFVWSALPHSISAYVLLGFSVLSYLFYRFLHQEASNVENFKDALYCEAYIRSQLIPEQVAAYKEKIRQGNTEEFAAAMTELKGILK